MENNTQNPKLIVAVNKNPTKMGVKAQFKFPYEIDDEDRDALTHKLQSKLSNGLEKNKMTINLDTDMSDKSVISFLIPIADIRMIVKEALTGREETI